VSNVDVKGWGWSLKLRLRRLRVMPSRVGKCLECVSEVDE